MEPVQRLTLMDLISALNDVTQDSREVVTVTLHLLASGRVRVGPQDADAT